MKILYYIDRLIKKIKRSYRQAVFFQKTNQRANLVGDIILINTNLKIGSNVTIYPHVQFFGNGLIEIGNNVSIGTGTIIYASKDGGVHIGDDTMIAAQCYIIDTDHGIKKNEKIRNQENSVSEINIKNDVWIGANVTVLKGSIIENCAIVGAKALVKGNLEENGIYVGVPAKKIKSRE